LHILCLCSLTMVHVSNVGVVSRCLRLPRQFTSIMDYCMALPWAAGSHATACPLSHATAAGSWLLPPWACFPLSHATAAVLRRLAPPQARSRPSRAPPPRSLRPCMARPSVHRSIALRRLLALLLPRQRTLPRPRPRVQRLVLTAHYAVVSCCTDG
jgi:hypothetical protein